MSKPSALSNRNKDTLSVAVSLFNEEENIAALQGTLTSVLSESNLTNYEIVFVNDGSTDNTLARCKEAIKRDPHVKIVNFARNFGHEIAMTAGMNHATMDAVVFMDGDFQHPPELIKKLMKEWQSGYDIVFTRRADSIKRNIIYAFYALGSNIFYGLINFLSPTPMPKNYTNFRLLDKKFITWLEQLTESERLFRGLLNWIGSSNSTTIDFVIPERRFGKPSYNLMMSFGLAINGIVQFSIRPLRLSLLLGVLAIVFLVGFGIFTLYEYFIQGKVMDSGYTTIIMLMSFFASIQLIILGIIGEYIGRIHIESKRRPLYFAEVFSADLVLDA